MMTCTLKAFGYCYCLTNVAKVLFGQYDFVKRCEPPWSLTTKLLHIVACTALHEVVLTFCAAQHACKEPMYTG